MTLLVWLLQDSARPRFLYCLTFGSTFGRAFAAAPIALSLASHYFLSLFFQCYLYSVSENGGIQQRGVKGQEEEGKDAGQIGSTVVLSRRPQRIHRHEAI